MCIFLQIKIPINIVITNKRMNAPWPKLTPALAARLSGVWDRFADEPFDDVLAQPWCWRKVCTIGRTFMACPRWSPLGLSVWTFALAFVFSAFRAAWIALLFLVFYEFLIILFNSGCGRSSWDVGRVLVLFSGLAGILLGKGMTSLRHQGFGGFMKQDTKIKTWAYIFAPAAIAASVAWFYLSNDTVGKVCRCKDEIVATQTISLLVVVYAWGLLTSPRVP